MGFTRFLKVFLVAAGRYWLLLVVTGCYWVLIGFQ